MLKSIGTRTILRWMIYMTIFLLPFGPKFPSKVGNIHVTSVFLFGVIGLWLMRKAISQEYVKTKLSLPVFCFVMIYAVFGSIHYLRGASDRTGFLRTLQMLEYAMLYFLVVDLFDTRERIKLLICLFLTAVSLEMIIAVVHYHYRLSWVNKYYTLDSTYPLNQMVGTFSGEHNGLAPYILLGSMLIFGFALRIRGLFRKILLMTSFIPFMYCLLFSMSRTVYVAFFAGVLFIIFIDEMGILSRIKQIALAASLVAVLIFIIGSYNFFGTVKDRFLSISTSDPYTGAIGARTVEVWHISLSIFSFRSPFDTVCGAGTYKGVIHNCFTRVLYNTGVIGLALFIWLIYVIFKESFETLRKIPETDTFMKGFSVGLTGALLPYLIGFSLAIPTILIHRTIGNFWILLGAISAIQIIVDRSDAQEQLPR